MNDRRSVLAGILVYGITLYGSAFANEVAVSEVTAPTGVTATVPVIGAAKDRQFAGEVDFGEEGDVILRVSLRDIPLTDGMYALMNNGQLYLPLGELSTLVDFPIIVDPVRGLATGWYLKPENKFHLSASTQTVKVRGEQYYFEETDFIADDLDLFINSVVLQQWFPLVFDVSLLSQSLVIRSSEILPKEMARERQKRKATKEVSFSARKPYDIPAYRLLDWPEVSMSLGSSYSSASDVVGYDYRLRAVGDLAFMSAKFGFSGDVDGTDSATLTLGRNNPNGKVGPLRIADFELGDTSQYLPSLIGGSLSGRGVRFGNERLGSRRDLDTIDIQGVQEADYEVELYVNDRLHEVDRDSSDFYYNFQDVPLSFGQNELRLEFYGQQGQRHTEIRRSFVGSGTGQKGLFTYEMALIEPSKKVFDIVDDVRQNSTSDTDDDQDAALRLSSALNITYGLSRNANLALTLASVDVGQEIEVANRNYMNAKITSDIEGVLVSGAVAIDSAGKVAVAANARTELYGHELSLAQRVTQREYQTTTQLGNAENSSSGARLDTRASITKRFFPVSGGRLSYAAAGGYVETFGELRTLSLGTRLDYQTRLVGLSWQNDLLHNIASESNNNTGQFGVALRHSARTLWRLSSSVGYSEATDKFFNNGSLRLSRAFFNNGSLSIAANRDLENESNNYSAAWVQSFQQFHFNSSVFGSSRDNISVRLGVELAVKRHPKRWLPRLSSTGGRSSVAVLVYADDNGNNVYDTDESVVEGIGLTRNGLHAGVATDSNGIALLNGLSSSASVDLGLVETDIDQPDLKYTGIEKGILPRPGRIPIVEVPLLRATDLEGTVTLAGDTPVPNVRMVLTPVGAGEPIEIRTEYDGYYYLAGIPLGTYDLGPDAEQLQQAGFVVNPPTRRLVLENLDDFPLPEDFELSRLADAGQSEAGEPQLAAALGVDQPASHTDESSTVSWTETRQP